MPPPTFNGDDDDVVDAEPLEGVHGADDVDDRVEGADLVQMDPLDRRVVDRGFGLGEPLEQMDCPFLPLGRQRGPPDRCDDVRQVMVRMMMLAESCAGS